MFFNYVLDIVQLLLLFKSKWCYFEVMTIISWTIALPRNKLTIGPLYGRLCDFSLINLTRVGLNSEYGTNTEYQIIRFLKILRIPNTELFGFWKWTNTEYRIVLFGLNYSNTEYLTSNSTPKKFFICEFCEKWDEDTLILYFHTYMRAFYCVFYTYLAYKKF